MFNACRVKPCFCCYNYSHIGTQCNAGQACGYCAELHETKNCKQKGVEGCTPRCTVCKGVHTAWSNACSARKKELVRDEQAKQVRNIYWHVISKDESPRDDNPRSKHRRTREPAANRIIAVANSPEVEPSDHGTRALEPPNARAGNSLQESQIPVEIEAARTLSATPIAEDWATPASPEEPLIDPQLLATERLLEADPAADGVPNAEVVEMAPIDAASSQQPLYPIWEEFNVHDADAWLAGLADSLPEDGPHLPETAGSPLTSVATNNSTAQGNIYKGCNCPEHQEIYGNWPTRDAELTITKCMKICMYCGKDFEVASELRSHIRKRRNANPPIRSPNNSQPIPHKQHRRSTALMTRHQELQILQYNIQNSRDVVLASLFQDPRILEYNVLAIQEPRRNPFIATSYHPLKAHFQLTYLDDNATRVCFYINKRIDPGTWSVSHLSKDITTLAIRDPSSGRNIRVFNVYNEVRTDTLSTLAGAIDRLESYKEAIVLGDFNLHHPLWSAAHRQARYGPNAQELLTIIENFQLQLLTVPGTPTHRWKDGEINLAFGIPHNPLQD
ncbi:uncharacterized protein BDCG_17412 [Blastomyces dermatitidis ER-3]|uniref:C2H2-type domain-containing protein n=1 Tax=Ajellomyces dermatitidis (strain ER-3 / ATCC MYA-2586) TaxID=559297 RepID=A0ABX2VYC4_AJEDR|nr:uncharacterized protein BDCG_17412 [Blastomyces dermatitidis ER-3]OAT02150.1 hypothetical protein BDCG_17412 [Blastomyces dermatitidis ER-3]